jgi:hypothetical protein
VGHLAHGHLAIHPVHRLRHLLGELPISVISSGYVPLNAASVHTQNELGRLDGGKDLAKPVPTDGQEGPVAKALRAWTVVHLHGARVAPIPTAVFPTSWSPS